MILLLGQEKQGIMGRITTVSICITTCNTSWPGFFDLFDHIFFFLCQIWIRGSLHHAGAGGQVSASESVSSTELRGWTCHCTKSLSSLVMSLPPVCPTAGRQKRKTNRLVFHLIDTQNNDRRRHNLWPSWQLHPHWAWKAVSCFYSFEHLVWSSAWKGMNTLHTFLCLGFKLMFAVCSLVVCVQWWYNDTSEI